MGKSTHSLVEATSTSPLNMPSALSCSFFATAIPFGSICWLASQGWPFPPAEENCFENFATEKSCYCERPQGDYPGHFLIAQPVNTFSNVVFVVIGTLVAV